MELVRIDEEKTKGIVAYDYEQGKSLEFIYGGNLDYYVVANIYPSGMLESDRSLMFVLDKSNIELYNAFNWFFDNVKDISLRLKSGNNQIYLPPSFDQATSCYNSYDKNELYNAEQNQIQWQSEAGAGLNRDTIMYVKGNNDKFNFTFVNDELCQVNERYQRIVCICNSGSRSFIFPYLFSFLFSQLKQLPTTTSYEEAETKILRK